MDLPELEKPQPEFHELPSEAQLDYDGVWTDKPTEADIIAAKDVIGRCAELGLFLHQNPDPMSPDVRVRLFNQMMPAINTCELYFESWGLTEDDLQRFAPKAEAAQ
ncbi:hypothetical protein [Shimia thalassica]|uniref:hypothetical protein n=1 Tax=Shimia thalassica TaxID=1715693 RepID=UPI00273616D4|nr:hypothetical protein [Shimia thalassica]MDP2520137.1 hypothetical protein [Shimia thalassica]